MKRNGYRPYSRPFDLDELKSMLSYCPETGIFTWTKHHAKQVKIGSEAGWLGNDGYRHIQLLGKNYLTHRLAWFYTYGRWPTHQIDHINRNRADNRLCNLREATCAQNAWNTEHARRTRPGGRGSHFHLATGLWLSSITANGKKIYLGYFQTSEEAAAAYAEAAKTIHGEFRLKQSEDGQ